MNEIEKKALALLNEVAAERGVSLPLVTIDRGLFVHEALCRAIEHHEAYKQEVSDAVEVVVEVFKHEAEFPALERFIIPKPTVDTLVEALIKGGIVNLGAAEMAADIREALAKRGLKIVEVER